MIIYDIPYFTNSYETELIFFFFILSLKEECHDDRDKNKMLKLRKIARRILELYTFKNFIYIRQ